MKVKFHYQKGYLYEDHGAWYVQYRQRISQLDGSSQLKRVSKCLGRSNDFSNIFEVEKSRESFMQTVNRDRLSANSRITLTAFVEGAYLPWTKEERRASTSKGHEEIWINYLRNRVGELRLREFRTVDASRMLCAIAKERDLTKTTLQHIKSVLSTIFTFAKNDGAFDGANPVDGVLIPWDAREPGETHAYDLTQVLQILDRLPLIAKGLVATAAFAGLRLGELRGLEWTDYIVVFHSGNRRPINADKLGRRVIRPTLEAIDLPWYGWHAFRRGLASNLYAMGAPDKVVQRILRHSKPHVTKEHYIKVFDSTVVEAVNKMQAQIEELRKAQGDRQQLELRFVDDQPATSAPQCSMGNGFPHFSKARPAVGQQILSSWVGSD